MAGEAGEDDAVRGFHEHRGIKVASTQGQKGEVLCCVAYPYLRSTYLIAGVSSYFNKESTPLVSLLAHTCASWKSNLGEFQRHAKTNEGGSAKPAKRLSRNWVGTAASYKNTVPSSIFNAARPSQLQPQRLSPPPRSIAISIQAGRRTEYPSCDSREALETAFHRPREAPLLRPQQADFHATSARLCQRRGFQLDTHLWQQRRDIPEIWS
ncbi:uncharacterized protein K444DRAFT_608925 [Hyaloscypha bicolor E]|uniref:Uncharacterized protein n=1 Tax=Hyaloscypha bicolor E TaxID=1095630 RepID=A0A2J6TNP4_9HELO|nr:uncharacterized protein K444DRAFT_608925 [Hyaloscypha bicolor E]PMD64568.1 hypothetical protein K444DRAFT_608925 [Hyaloscypha bicolor E]